MKTLGAPIFLATLLLFIHLSSKAFSQDTVSEETPSEANVTSSSEDDFRPSVHSAFAQNPLEGSFAAGVRIFSTTEPSLTLAPTLTLDYSRSLAPGWDLQLMASSIGVFSAFEAGMKKNLYQSSHRAWDLHSGVTLNSLLSLPEDSFAHLWGFNPGTSYTFLFTSTEIGLTLSLDAPMYFPKLTKTRVAGEPRQYRNVVNALRPGITAEFPCIGECVTFLQSQTTLVLDRGGISAVAPTYYIGVAW